MTDVNLKQADLSAESEKVSAVGTNFRGGTGKFLKLDPLKGTFLRSLVRKVANREGLFGFKIRDNYEIIMITFYS